MAMMGGPSPAMGGYDPSRGRYHYNTGALRDRHHQAGPSPWVPATILGVITLITLMPYMRPANATMVMYNRQGAVWASLPGTSRFPTPLLWIPVVAVIALQFFGSSNWYRGVYVGDRGPYGARPGGAAAGGWWPRSGSRPYRRYNAHQQRGLLATFMDLGGHWFLIFLGVAVFTLVSSSSVSSSSSGRAARVRIVPMAPRRLRFPWSLICRFL